MNCKMLIFTYRRKANDSMGIIVGWDNDSHLTTKSYFCSTLWIFQADIEVLSHLWDVIVNDIHCYFQLTVTGCKVQLTRAKREQITQYVQNALWFSVFMEHKNLLTLSIPGDEIRLVGDRSKFIYSGAIVLSSCQQSLGSSDGGDHNREIAIGSRGPQDYGKQVDIRSPGVEK